MKSLSEDVVPWVRSCLLNGNILSWIDRTLSSSISNEDALWKVLEVAMCCVERRSDQRPNMSEVVRGLQHALELEEDPSMRNPTALATLLRNKAQKWDSS